VIQKHDRLCVIVRRLLPGIGVAGAGGNSFEKIADPVRGIVVQQPPGNLEGGPRLGSAATRSRNRK
jgi:hypothetical protein